MILKLQIDTISDVSNQTRRNTEQSEFKMPRKSPTAFILDDMSLSMYDDLEEIHAATQAMVLQVARELNFIIEMESSDEDF